MAWRAAILGAVESRTLLGDLSAAAIFFEKALAELPRHREGRGRFRSWLFAIAHNGIADENRAPRPFPECTAASIEVGPTPEEVALAGETQQTVWNLLALLSPNQASVLEW